MVAGAKAGIKQNGNVVSTPTPNTPVSIFILVNRMADAEVIRISTKPNVFQAMASFLAYGFWFLIARATQILVKAVVISPSPATKANTGGNKPNDNSIRKKLPINLNRCNRISA